jgi:dTDP-glucose 4,6-dehydratase
MKLFVTGGAGFTGSNFIRYVLGLGEGYKVVNFDKLTYAGNLASNSSVLGDPNYFFIKGDICDGEAAESAMRGCDVVLNFAAESHVDRSIYQPMTAMHTNVMGTNTLLQVARAVGVPRFVQISTDEVYGDIPPGSSADEKFPIAPSSPYSASKAGADLLLLSYVRTYGFPGLITRSSNNYGPFQFPEKFIPLVILSALEEKPVPIYGDGKQQRTWLHVMDNCRGILAVLQRGRCGEVYNIGGSNICENIALAQKLLCMINKPESLLEHVEDRPGHDRRYALSCEKIKRDLGWEPQISLEEGLHRTIEWYQSNASWVKDVRSGEYLSYYKQNYENRASSLKSLGHSRTGISSDNNS